jgi:hypothetical protein
MQRLYPSSGSGMMLIASHGLGAPSSSFVSEQIRRASIASTGTVSSTASSVVGNGRMTEEEEQERRRSIKTIMCDPALSQKEKSRKIQALMDGRGQCLPVAQQSLLGSANNRRGSASSYCSNASSVYATSMAQVAADAAAETIYSDYEASLHASQSTYSYSSSQPDGCVAQQQLPANDGLLGTGTYKQYHGRSKSLQDWNDTDRAAAAAHTTVFGNKIQQVSRLMEQSRPACEHYERNCSIISPCCGLAFGCRICHDDCPVLPSPIVFQRRLSANNAIPSNTLATAYNNVTAATNVLGTTQIHHMNKLERRRSMPTEFNADQNSEDDHHLIDRFAIREVICRHCYTRQSSKT